jgi:glutathione S-transferase
VTLADSSVICAYLERIHPEPPLYPREPADYARALWFEEYGDGGLAPVVGKIFFPKIIAPLVFNRQPDENELRRVEREELPAFLDYLEGQIGGRDFLVANRFTIGDIGIATQFASLRHCGIRPDPHGRPNLSRYVAALLARPSFKSVIEEEARTLGLAS